MQCCYSLCYFTTNFNNAMWILGKLYDLLKKDNSALICHNNMQALVTEMFKVKNNIALKIMKVLFAPKIGQYDLRNNNWFKRRKGNSFWRGTESVSYLGSTMWGIAPIEIKTSETLSVFKFRIKRLVPKGCP